MSKQTNEELEYLSGQIKNLQEITKNHRDLIQDLGAKVYALEQDCVPTATGWQPIETAPRDGTFILVSTGTICTPTTGVKMAMVRWEVPVGYPHRGYWSPVFTTSEYHGAKYWTSLPEIPDDEPYCDDGDSESGIRAFEYLVNQFSKLLNGECSHLREKGIEIIEEGYKILNGQSFEVKIK